MRSRRSFAFVLAVVGLVVPSLPARAAAPETTITSGPSGVIAKRSAKFAFTTNVVGATFQCKIDRQTWSSCTSPKKYTSLEQGTHKFRVRARKNGVTDPTPAKRTFTVDTVRPKTTITEGPSGTIEERSPSFAFTSSEPGTFMCRLFAAAFEPCSSPFVPSVPLPEGTFTFEVYAQDLAGNVDATPAARTFSIDLPLSQTLDTATIAAQRYLDEGMVIDWPASCPTWDCLNDQPMPASDQLSFDVTSRSVTEVEGATFNRYDVSTRFDMSTLEPITFTALGVTCDAVLTPSNGSTVTWRFDMQLQFSQSAETGELVITPANASLLDVEPDDLSLSGGFMCSQSTMADAFSGAFTDAFEDVLIDRGGWQLCAAPGPEYLEPCPQP